MAEEAEGKRDAADNRASATTGAVKVMEENERDRYAQEHEALTRAIAIIKAAQAVVDNAEVLWEDDCECLVVKRLDFPVGPPAWAVMHSFGSSDFVLKDWHPEQGDVDWDTMTIKF